MPRRMFGTAGVRGVTNVEITPQLAMGLGLAFGDWLATRGGIGLSASVGHDTRYGSVMLARAAASGLASAGINVQFYGCVSTGVFSFNLVRTQQAGGILITGSHMPPDRNGIICILHDGTYAPYEITDDVEARYHALASRTRRVRPEDIGRLEEAMHPEEFYVSSIVQQLDARTVRERKYKVVIDCANGTASYIAKELFEWFGCETEMMNFDPSPVPARPSEPRASTTAEAQKRVREAGADLGVAFDVDADRVLFITHEGEPVSEDTVGAIFAREELRKGDVCVTPVNSSGLIELVCRDAGARLEYCEVGQPPTAKAMKEHSAAYAYEESGKYYFPRSYLWADGPFGGVKMLEVMARHGRPLAQIAADFPRFRQVKHTVHVDDGRKEAIARAAEELLAQRMLDGRVRDITVDGFKRVFADNSWLLVRKSGTEPLIRVYSDAPTEERAQALVKEGAAVLADAISRVR